nr:hypothetical protein [Paracoccus pantotrophus]
MGADALGRPRLARIIVATRNTMTVAAGAVLFSADIGSAFGLVAGHAGPRVSQVIMRLADMIMSFPSLLIAVIVLCIPGPSVLNLIIVLADHPHSGLSAHHPRRGAGGQAEHVRFGRPRPGRILGADHLSPYPAGGARFRRSRHGHAAWQGRRAGSGASGVRGPRQPCTQALLAAGLDPDPEMQARRREARRLLAACWASGLA